MEQLRAYVNMLNLCWWITNTEAKVKYCGREVAWIADDFDCGTCRECQEEQP